MSSIIRASWDDLEEVVRVARDELVLCTPYYSREGIERVFDATPPGMRSLMVATRLSPTDWLNEVAAPQELAVMLRLFADAGVGTTLWIHQRLHAKAYLADCSTGLVGSGNLTAGGFGRNFELMARVGGPEAAAVKALIQWELSENGTRLPVSDLEGWVAQNCERVAALRSRSVGVWEELAEAQRGLDALLGYGRRPTVTRVTRPDRAAFVAWLDQHAHLSGAKILLHRFRNIDGQNLVGHCKQTFGAVCDFLRAHDATLGALAVVLDALPANEMYEPDPDVVRSWIQHIDDNATVRDDEYDYAVLRGILPPSLGGTRQGGGGGSSTLKRMMPLVARFLRDL